MIDTAGDVDSFPLPWLRRVLQRGRTATFRQERIYIPTGKGYSTYGVNGEISADDQTVRLNYGDEFRFRVIDDKYSDSAYAVYLVLGLSVEPAQL